MNVNSFYTRREEEAGITLLGAYKKSIAELESWRTAFAKENGAPDSIVEIHARIARGNKELPDEHFKSKTSKGKRLLDSVVTSYQLVSTVLGHTVYDDMVATAEDGTRYKIQCRKGMLQAKRVK